MDDAEICGRDEKRADVTDILKLHIVRVWDSGIYRIAVRPRGGCEY